MKCLTIIRLKHGKEEEVRKICEDFKKTSESKREPFEYEIKENKLIITKNRDVKQAYRRMKFFQKPDFKNLVIYTFVKKIEESNGV